jgi:hypothetical protein
MPLPLRPSDTDRAEPQIAAPGPHPIAEPASRRRAFPTRGHETANPPLRFPGERPSIGLTAGERMVVSSVMTGGEGKPRRRFRLLRLFLILVVLVLAGMGAAAAYHAVAEALPH